MVALSPGSFLLNFLLDRWPFSGRRPEFVVLKEGQAQIFNILNKNLSKKISPSRHSK